MKISSKNTFGKVAVLYGGSSPERDISLQSGMAVLAGLHQASVEAVGLDIKDFSEVQHAVSTAAPDRVFIVLHGKGGEDGIVQGLLEAMRIPYTGSGILGSSLSINKLASKCIWRSKGLPTPAFADLSESFDVEDVIATVGLPAAVKPAYEGSSFGISRVATVEALLDAWQLARSYSEVVFAERWMDGAEYSVAFVGDRIFPPIELRTAESFYDYRAKYERGYTEYICPAPLPIQQTSALQTLAWMAAQALGVDGWGRVDLRAAADKGFTLLEVNTVPGMTEHSLVPMAAQQDDMNFAQLVLAILETSRGRKNGANLVYF